LKPPPAGALPLSIHFLLEAIPTLRIWP
jgi:hypothetical protein